MKPFHTVSIPCVRENKIVTSRENALALFSLCSFLSQVSNHLICWCKVTTFFWCVSRNSFSKCVSIVVFLSNKKWSASIECKRFLFAVWRFLFTFGVSLQHFFFWMWYPKSCIKIPGWKHSYCHQPAIVRGHERMMAYCTQSHKHTSLPYLLLSVS